MLTLAFLEMSESGSLAACTFTDICLFSTCTTQSDTVSAFNVNDFIHPELNHCFLVDFQLKQVKSGLAHGQQQLYFDCRLDKVSCHGLSESFKNVGSNFAFWYGSPSFIYK